MVYVKNIQGEPLMPCTEAKAKKLLKRKSAKVLTVKPFTIQLLFECENITQNVTLKLDSGYLNIGFSAITETKELISGEVKLLKNMSQRITERAMYRNNRRSRLRYRKPRWQNRKINKGWLAPSIQHKLDSHIRFVDKMKSILPITRVIVEVGAFDIQKIKNPEISNKEYQQGEQENFWNLREYILHRDGHKCQNPNCKNSDKNIPLQLHHIIYKSNGGTDTSNNLITLCIKCHTDPNHKKGKLLDLWQTNKPKIRGFRDATFMNIVRWKLVNILQCEHTYGYLTKSKRIELGLDKTHYNDAFCIADGSNNTQVRIKPLEFNQIRRNNRSLEVWYDAKYIDIRISEKNSGRELNNGRRTRNKNLNSENLRVFRGEKVSKGRRNIRRQRYFYQPGNLVKYENKIYTVKGTHCYGKAVGLKELNKDINPKFLIPYKFRKGIN